MSRGGARKGAGRPKLGAAKRIKSLRLYVNASELERYKQASGDVPVTVWLRSLADGASKPTFHTGGIVEGCDGPAYITRDGVISKRATEALGPAPLQPFRTVDGVPVDEVSRTFDLRVDFTPKEKP